MTTTTMTVLAEANTNDGYRTLALSGGVSVTVRDDFDAPIGARVVVEEDEDGDSHIVDVLKETPTAADLEEQGYSSDEAAHVAATWAEGVANGTMTPEGTLVTREPEATRTALTITVTATRKRRIVLTSEDLAPIVPVRTPAELKRPVRTMAPVTVPTSDGRDESPTPVDPSATTSLSAAEQVIELEWINRVCAAACARVGIDWDSVGITASMAPRFTRCMGKAMCTCRLWGSVRGRVRISAAFIYRRADQEERFNTVIHELAHVLAPARAGRRIKPHGTEWRAMHRELAPAIEPSTTHSVPTLDTTRMFDALTDLSPGMTVVFGRHGGQMTRATVVKVNRAKVRVTLLEPRGRTRIRPVGTVMFVPLGMILRDEG